MWWQKNEKTPGEQSKRNAITYSGNYSMALSKISVHVGDVKNLDTRWGEILVKDDYVCSIAGNNIFLQYLSRGGEGIIILARREMSDHHVVFKFALPKMIEGWEKDKHSSIIRNKIENKGDRDNQYFNEFTLRWIRGCSIQKQLFNIQKKGGLYQFGIIPELVAHSKPPKLFCKMEFINGKSLLFWCMNSREDERVKIFYKICSLIERILHDNNIIHSDIKAGNILVLKDEKTGESMPVLLDFQTSKDLSIESDITHVNTRLGNPLYSSEDQWESSKNRSFTDDIVSIGKLLWVMYAKAEPEIIDKENSAKNVKDIYPDGLLPMPLQHVFDRATDKDKSKRYAGLAQMREDIKKAFSELYQKTVDGEVSQSKKASVAKKENKSFLITSEKADELAFESMVEIGCQKKYVYYFVRASLALIEKPDIEKEMK